MEQPINRVLAWELANGNVSITYFYRSAIDRSGLTEDQYVNETIRVLRRDQPDFKSAVVHEGTLSDIPQSRTDRKFWSLKNGKIQVDSAKKQAEIDEIAARAAVEDAVMTKLKLNRGEFNVLPNIIGSPKGVIK